MSDRIDVKELAPYARIVAEVLSGRYKSRKWKENCANPEQSKSDENAND